MVLLLVSLSNDQTDPKRGYPQKDTLFPILIRTAQCCKTLPGSNNLMISSCALWAVHYSPQSRARTSESVLGSRMEWDGEDWGRSGRWQSVIGISILWMDEILHHLRHPGTMIPRYIPTNNGFPMFFRWCERDFVHPQYLHYLHVLPQCITGSGTLGTWPYCEASMSGAVPSRPLTTQETFYPCVLSNIAHYTIIPAYE